MKNFKTIILIAVLLVTATACKKIKQHKPIIVNFKVLNPVTKNAYKNVRWYIMKVETKKNYLNDDYVFTFFKEGFTDENGEAYIEFKRPMSKKIDYLLYVDQKTLPSNFTANKTVWELKDKTEQDINCFVGEEVNFVLHIKNTNCFDADDKALLSLIQGKYYKKKIFYEESIKLGCYDYTTPYNIEMIEDIYPYTIEITRNGQTTTIEDSFTVTKAMEGDTINIFY